LAFESALTALLVSSSEKLQRLVRRVLSDLEIQVVSCPDGETAIQKVTRQRFEAVLVDFGDSVAADQVIRGLQLAPGNKRAIVVAFVDPEVPLKSAFARGAHFVLHKSLSAERTKSSFRAVRALMKRERRRNQRVPVEMSVKCDWLDKSAMTCQSSDLGEGGMALRLPNSAPATGVVQLSFFVPQALDAIKVGGTDISSIEPLLTQLDRLAIALQIVIRYFQPGFRGQHLGEGLFDGEDGLPFRILVLALGDVRGGMSKVKPPAPLLPSLEEAREVGRIGIRVAGVVSRQGHVGAGGFRQVCVVPSSQRVAPA